MAHDELRPTRHPDQAGPDRSGNVIGLDRGERNDRARVRVERDADRLAALSDDERRRLLVRVLCELVALQDPAPRALAS